MGSVSVVRATERVLMFPRWWVLKWFTGFCVRGRNERTQLRMPSVFSTQKHLSCIIYNSKLLITEWLRISPISQSLKHTICMRGKVRDRVYVFKKGLLLFNDKERHLKQFVYLSWIFPLLWLGGKKREHSVAPSSRISTLENAVALNLISVLASVISTNNCANIMQSWRCAARLRFGWLTPDHIFAGLARADWLS